MKLRSRFLAFCTATLLVLSALATAVSAAEGDVKPTRVSVKPVSKTLVVGTDFTLEAIIRPDDANVDLDLTWRSSDSDVAEVDDDGTVTAYAPGVATITVRTANGKAGTCEIRVPGKAAYSDQDTDANDTGNRDGAAGTQSGPTARGSDADTDITPVRSVSLTQHLDRDVLLDAVRAAGSSRTILSNYASVSADSLIAATSISDAKISFDTKLEGKVVGRLTIAPQAAKSIEGNLKIGVYSGTGNTAAVQKRFGTSFRNVVAVLRCEQSSFPLPVEVAVRVGDRDADSLRFYSYTSSTNKYAALEVDDVRVDGSGFVHFTTKKGGYIIISNGKLAAK